MSAARWPIQARCIGCGAWLGRAHIPGTAPTCADCTHPADPDDELGADWDTWDDSTWR